ncbi:MAG: hypothetical protein JNL51_04705 [Chitinophagaceae bacterium]|nr:hypothetical protein [Chitinophagaceae bacterium]
MEQQSLNVLDLHYDQESIGYFEQSAKWAKFIAIVGFVFSGLFVILSFFIGSIFSSMPEMSAPGFGMLGGGAITAIYLVIALINFFPCLYLFRFATRLQEAVKANDGVKMNNALKNLKSFFKFIGVVLIVTLAFYAVAIIGGIIFVAAMGSQV